MTHKLHSKRYYAKLMEKAARKDMFGDSSSAYVALMHISQDMFLPNLDLELRINFFYMLFQISWKVLGSLEALQYGEMAAMISEDKNIKSQIYSQLALYALQIGFKGADDYISMCVANAENDTQRGFANRIKGKQMLLQMKYDDALPYLFVSEDYFEKSNQYRMLASVKMDIADAFFGKGLQQTALNILCGAETMFNILHDLNFKVRWSVKKAQYLYEMGQDVAAKNEIIKLKYNFD